MEQRSGFMGNITTGLLDQSCEKELFEFELENRFFFEKIGLHNYGDI